MKNLSSINESQDIVNKKYVDELAESKVDKVDGKGLSTNDFTDEEKSKLNNIAENANNYELPVASKDALGGVIIGNNLSIDENGVLSATGGSGGTGATEVSIGTEEPTEDSVVIWVDTNELENTVSLINQTGLYNEDFQYKVNDMIMYNDAWYLCHIPVVGIAPNEDLGFEDPYWYPVGGGKTKGFTVLEASTDNVIDFNTLTEPGIYLIKNCSDGVGTTLNGLITSTTYTYTVL